MLSTLTRDGTLKGNGSGTETKLALTPFYMHEIRHSLNSLSNAHRRLVELATQGLGLVPPVCEKTFNDVVAVVKELKKTRENEKGLGREERRERLLATYRELGRVLDGSEKERGEEVGGFFSLQRMVCKPEQILL